MTDYTITTNFGAKDSLPSGNAGKVIKGEEFTTEFTNIQTAVNTKADTAGDTFTGAVNFSADVAVNTNTLFVDVSEAKVGIGTTSPTGSLTVFNSVAPSIKLQNNTSGSATGDGLQFYVSGATGYIDHKESGSLNFNVNASERMRIDASGNVGIGANSPDGKLDIEGDFETTKALVLTNTKGAGKVTYIRSHGADGEALALYHDGQRRQIWDSTGYIAFEGTDGAEDMRIDSSGNLLVGTTSYQGGGGSGAKGFYAGSDGLLSSARSGATVAVLNRTTSDGTITEFRKDGTQIGSIGTVTASGTRYFYIGNNSANSGIGFYDTGIYPSNGLGGFSTNNKNLGSSVVRWLTAYLTQQPNVSSDQRLKENIEDADDAGSTIDAIQVRKFDWIEDGRHQKYGMIAQELAEVYPEAVNVPENEEDTLGIATGDLIPMLIKEVQSLRSRVAELENV